MILYEDEREGGREGGIKVALSIEVGNFFDLKNSKRFWTCIFDAVDVFNVWSSPKNAHFEPFFVDLKKSTSVEFESTFLSRMMLEIAW